MANYQQVPDEPPLILMEDDKPLGDAERLHKEHFDRLEEQRKRAYEELEESPLHVTISKDDIVRVYFQVQGQYNH